MALGERRSALVVDLNVRVDAEKRVDTGVKADLERALGRVPNSLRGGHARRARGVEREVVYLGDRVGRAKDRIHREVDWVAAAGLMRGGVRGRRARVGEPRVVRLHGLQRSAFARGRERNDARGARARRLLDVREGCRDRRDVGQVVRAEHIAAAGDRFPERGRAVGLEELARVARLRRQRVAAASTAAACTTRRNHRPLRASGGDILPSRRVVRVLEREVGRAVPREEIATLRDHSLLPLAAVRIDQRRRRGQFLLRQRRVDRVLNLDDETALELCNALLRGLRQRA